MAAFAVGSERASACVKPENSSEAPSGGAVAMKNAPFASHRVGCAVLLRAMLEKTTTAGAAAPAPLAPWRATTRGSIFRSSTRTSGCAGSGWSDVVATANGKPCCGSPRVCHFPSSACGGRDVRSGEHVPERQIEEVARLAVDVAGKVHQRHPADHPCARGSSTPETGHGTFGFPIGLQRSPDRWELGGGRDAIKLETGVPHVHVEVNAELAAGADHRLGEHFGGDLGAVEVSDEVLSRQADPGAHAVHLVGLSRRGSAPPRSAIGIELLVFDQHREVLSVRQDPIGDPFICGPLAKAGGAIAHRCHGGGVRLRRKVDDAISHHSELAVERLKAAVHAGHQRDR